VLFEEGIGRGVVVEEYGWDGVGVLVEPAGVGSIFWWFLSPRQCFRELG
jgi:hypothetical protein